jgi:DMSO reductase family type II enzyme heme b subunit
LVGQIVQKPRWFMPSVDGVWVQAVHDDKNLVLKLSWDDRSQSPNPVWDEWLARVMKGASDVDGALPTKQGPDRFWVQFPKQIPGLDDTERPYFLGGSTRKPVYLWRWASSPDASEEGTGAGLGQFTARAGNSDLTHAAVWDQGEWELQFSRPLRPSDTTAAPTFTTGRPIPIAFFAFDGSNGETELRGSVSAWYAIYLDVPTPANVYLTPVVAVLLAAGLCVTVVWRAQQRDRTARR